MVGFAPIYMNVTQSSVYTSCGHYYYCRANLYGQNGISGTSYGRQYGTGDVITGVYDTKAKTISFSVNGTNFGVAYSNITGDLYPAFIFYTVGDQITLIP